jgi:hypothetical protein
LTSLFKAPQSLFMKQIFTLIFLSFVILAQAQSKTGRIFGFLKNSDGKAIEAATVSLLQAENQALVKVSISARDGRFEFERIPAGKFLIAISATGYTPMKSAVIGITPENQTIDAGSFTGEQAAKDLGNLQVTSKRPLIENKINKTIVNVDASPSRGGSDEEQSRGRTE